jgi:hypothetical protein
VRLVAPLSPILIPYERETLRTRVYNLECLSRVTIGLNVQHRIRIRKGSKASQTVLKHVVETTAGAILEEELGYTKLYAWTEMLLGPVIEYFKRSGKGKCFQQLIGYFVNLQSCLNRVSRSC